MDQDQSLVAQDQLPTYSMKVRRNARLDHIRSLLHGIKVGITTTVVRPAALVVSLLKSSKVHGGCCACYPARAGTLSVECWRLIPRNVLHLMRYSKTSGSLGARFALKKRVELYSVATIMSIPWSLALALLPPPILSRRNKPV